MHSRQKVWQHLTMIAFFSFFLQSGHLTLQDGEGQDGYMTVT